MKSLNVEGNTAALEREIEGGKRIMECPLPLVASASEGMAEPRIPNMRGIMSCRTKALTVVEAIAVDPLVELTGFDKPTPRSSVKLVAPDDADELVQLLHTEAKVI